MNLRTVCVAMWRSGSTGPLLLMAQVALALVAVANISYLVFTRFETTGRASGMQESDVFWISSQGYKPEYDQAAAVEADLRLLNSLPHVIAAGVTNAVPETFESARTLVSSRADMQGMKRLALVYQFSERSIAALGLKLVAGKSLSREAISRQPLSEKDGLFGPEAVITDALAVKLFGSRHAALGKPLYHQDQVKGPATVVGVVEFMQAAPYFAEGADFVHEVAFTGAVPGGRVARYLVRADPGYRDVAMNQAIHALKDTHVGRYIGRSEALEESARQARGYDRNSALVMTVLAILVLAVTMLGLFGFASFAVTRRMREIGTRRAIGATRTDIIKQFLTENLVVSLVGCAIGLVLTAALAVKISMLLELPTLPSIYMLEAAALIVLCGLIAAFLPARRGGRVPPAVATRAG